LKLCGFKIQPALLEEQKTYSLTTYILFLPALAELESKQIFSCITACLVLPQLMPGFPSKNILERLATSFYYIQMEATCIG
jgi:hypothetical protein